MVQRIKWTIIEAFGKWKLGMKIPFGFSLLYMVEEYLNGKLSMKYGLIGTVHLVFTNLEQTVKQPLSFYMSAIWAKIVGT